MKNHREANQANYHKIMGMAMLYTRLAQIWYRSSKYTFAEKYAMCLDADRISDELRATAKSMVER